MVCFPVLQFYEEIHTPGHDAPFKVRGPNYLRDGVKVAPQQPTFELLGMEVVNTGSPEPLPHISRFLPSIRWVTDGHCWICCPSCLPAAVFLPSQYNSSLAIPREGGSMHVCMQAGWCVDW
jgi:hypothetical protein